MSLNELESASTLSVLSPRGLSRQAQKPPPLHSTSAVPAEESVDDNGGGDRMQGLDHCGILQNSCLPCRPSNSLSGDKRITTATPSLRRKVLSFKWREGHSAAAAVDHTPTLRECRPWTFPFVSIMMQLNNVDWQLILIFPVCVSFTEIACEKTTGRFYNSVLSH